MFRNHSMEPFVTSMRIMYEENMKKSTESYWRAKIADEISNYGKVMDKTIPLSESEISHGEYFLKHWTQYIVNNCIEIARGENNGTT